MNIRAERVKKWRKETKLRIIRAMGNSCQCCSYNRCYTALELHHLDPTQKELSFGKVMANPVAWKNKIVPELRKCILVCSNCHREIHQNIRQIPSKYAVFDESFLDYKPQTITHDKCPICGCLKPKFQLTCSYKCAVKKRGCVNWDSIDMKSLMSQYSNTEIGKMFDISESAVRKRQIKLGLYQNALKT